MSSRSLNDVTVWQTENMTFIRQILLPSGSQTSVFATLNDIGTSTNYWIAGWSPSNRTNRTVLSMHGRCHGLFVDLQEQIYCSMGDQHKVIRKPLIDSVSNVTVVAGNGTAGSLSTLLSRPQGIFVTKDFNLYVADCNNDRIQYYLFNDRNGTSVTLNGSNGTMALRCPTGVFLDVDGYLFISDSLNHRIIGSGSNGFRCIVGCTGTSGSTTNQLSSPTSLSFDSDGNLYVSDAGNHRIQKFLLDDNLCGEFSDAARRSVILILQCQRRYRSSFHRCAWERRISG